jgi:L-alanine-DL-glutamate epimerase-like enolase superfamily enzyme
MLARRLHEDDLFPGAQDPNGPRFRRWGFESAALDLALRQAGLTLAEALGRPARPVDFVLSLRLGDPSHIAPLARRLEQYPWARLKLDPVNDWDRRLVEQIAAYGRDRVAVLDFKALYGPSPFTPVPDPDLYAMCIEAFPDAWIEDPHLGPETRDVVAPHMDRVTWDAPLHGLDDITGLAHPPRCINVKPCRFGGLRALMEVYDHCEANGIAMYGGGFFEIGAGRGQLEYLASLFHPDSPNDVAPRGFHWPDAPDGLPSSPLTPAADALGFRWADADPPPDPPR